LQPISHSVRFERANRSNSHFVDGPARGNFGSIVALSSEPEQTMQQAIDRVMQTYGLMVNLTRDEEQAAREQVSKFLSQKDGDETQLAIEGLKFLRGDREIRT
jgi:hypothetical protein